MWITVVCFCANVGQGEEDFEAVRKKAIGCGASKVYVEDLRQEFVTDFVYPAVKCNAIYESRYLLGNWVTENLDPACLLLSLMHRNIHCKALYCESPS